jgi:flagellar hook-associated protein 2
MSDLSIPGVNSKYNTDKSIQALVENERIPLKRLESEREALQFQRSAWLMLNQKMTSVREGARELYGFQSPFGNKLAVSSDPSVLTATASRTAQEEKVAIRVKQIATADRFRSRSLPRDLKAPAGLYRFTIGKEEVKVNFRGGSLKELAAAINARGGSLLSASVVEDTPTTQVLVIESKKTGSANPLTLLDQAAAFGESIGLLERSPSAGRALPLSPAAVKTAPGVKISEGVLTLGPGTEARLPVQPPISLTGTMVLSLEVRVSQIPEEAYQKPAPPAGPSIPPTGGIDFKGIHVESAPSETVLPPAEQPKPPARVDDLSVLSAETSLGTVNLPALKDSPDFYTVEVGPGELPGALSALSMRNRNTHRTIEVRGVRVYDKAARGEYRPARPLSSAQDAVIEMDGVEVTRPENTLNDLLPGVSLTLQSAADNTVSLDVHKDLDSIKNSLIRFFGSYNDLLTRVDILARKDESVIRDAQFLSEPEREQAAKELGLLSGSTTLMQLKNRLQRIMMDPYPTDGGQQLALLAQMGITTSNGTFQGGALNKSLLRGYLQIDETKLEQAINRNPDWVRQLFGNDRNKDLVVDSGVAFAADTYLKSYVDSSGIVAGRVGALADSITRKSREIDAYNKHLVDYERELRRKFGIMESALDTLQQSSQTIENFNKRQQQ